MCGEIKITLCSRDALGQKKKKKKKMENSTDSQIGHFMVHLQYSKHIFSWSRAGKSLVRCLKRLISPGAPGLEAFYMHVISAPSLHRASTDTLIIMEHAKYSRSALPRNNCLKINKKSVQKTKGVRKHLV